MAPKSRKFTDGIPQALNSEVEHLRNLLTHLPATIPLSPEQSTYHFSLDPEDVEQEGMYYALNRNLEVCFETHKLPRDGSRKLLFKERGNRLKGLIALIKTVMKEAPLEREFLRERWVKRLTEAAIASGAKIPNKKRQIIELSSSDEDDTPRPQQTRLQLKHQPKKMRRTNAVTAAPAAQDSVKSVLDLVSDDEVEITQGPAPLTETPSEKHDSIPPTPPTVPPNTTPTVSIPTAPPRVASASNVPSSSCSKPGPAMPNLKQPSLFDVGMKRVSKEEAKVQTTRLFEEREEKRGEAIEREARVRAERKARKLEFNRQRQKRFRDNRREKKTHGGKGKHVKEMVLGCGSSRPLQDLAAISRPDGQNWKAKRKGTKGGVIHRRHERTSYWHPFLWTHIDRIAPRVGWSAAIIARTLQRDMPMLFSKLNKGTVHKWISKKGRRWSKNTLKNVERRHALAGSGRVGVLSPYPEIVEEIKKQLKDLRTSGICVSRLLARSIILAIIEKHKPELLATFKFSEEYVRTFLESAMDWTVRRGTRAAAHIPDDAAEVCERAFFRIVHLIHLYDIPPSLIVNMDQTGVLILMSNNKTYNSKGARDIEIVHRDEKRAYTLCVATTPAGDILPFQQVWAGKQKKSLPKDSAEGMDEAIELGMDFSLANSKKATSHFSTLKTMKEWMNNILKPWIQAYIDLHKLRSNQKAILFIDAYPVHTGEEFRIFVLKEFPNVFLIYVPRNCTPLFQPADVGLNRVVKHFLRQEALKFLVRSHTEQLATGLSPDQVKFSTSLPVLRDASVGPMVKLFNFLQGFDGRKIVVSAWDKCVNGEFNLGKDCLYSRKAKEAYRDYLENDTKFREEIRSKLGSQALAELEGSGDAENPDAAATQNTEEEEEEFDDGSEIPFAAIVQEALGVEIEAEEDQFCVARDAVASEDGIFRVTAQTENIWAYNDDGTLWDTQIPTVASM